MRKRYSFEKAPLRAIRASLEMGLSQSQTAKALGVSRQAVFQRIKNRSLEVPDHFYRIIRTCRVCGEKEIEKVPCGKRVRKTKHFNFVCGECKQDDSFKCTTCNATKHFSLFTIFSAKRHIGTCKDCRSKYLRAWQRRHRKRMREYWKMTRKNRKLRMG